MGKKEKTDIYETDQVNKKHRKKSKKLEKREKHKKNKKKHKKEKNEKRKLQKYIKQVFKENKKEIDISRLFEFCLNLEEIEKQIKKLLVLNPEAIVEIPELFKTMEEGRKEINLAGLEDKQVQKHLLKLMGNLKISQNPRNAFSYRISNLGVKRDIKKKYTTNPEELIPECLSSYYLLVKAIFEYSNYVMNNNVKEESEEEGESITDKEEAENEEDERFITDIDRNKDMKQLEKEKQEMDYEYELLEEKLGKNSELINKAFNKIMQEDSKNKNETIKEESEEELVGPPIPKFLADTMNLIETEENEDTNSVDKKDKPSQDPFEDLLKNNTFNKKGNKNLPTTAPRSTLEPINKESYDRLIAYERERMQYMSEHINDYDEKYRRTSLMEEYQQQKKKSNNIKEDIRNRPFDREKDMNIGRVDSKRALAIMRDQKGLSGRFEAKEKYIGY